MEAYKSKADKAIKLFLDREISFPDCLSALDAALADLIPRLTDQQLVQLRALMLTNNEIVMKEMERRGPPDENAKEPAIGTAAGNAVRLTPASPRR